MALYTLVVVLLYPSFRHQTSLNSLSRSTAAALFGITGKLTSPGGWLNANIYGNFFPLIMLLLTVGYGAAAVAGQDEDGALTLVTALPVRRRAIVLQKAGAMTVQALLLAAGVAVCVLIGRGFQLSISPPDTIAVSAALVLMGVDFGLITMAAGAATGWRGTALGAGAGLAAFSYLVSSLAPSISGIRPARYLSLLFWSATTRSAAGSAQPTSPSCWPWAWPPSRPRLWSSAGPISADVLTRSKAASNSRQQLLCPVPGRVSRHASQYRRPVMAVPPGRWRPACRGARRDLAGMVTGVPSARAR
jgi:ABC-2 type transport system permease protein